MAASSLDGLYYEFHIPLGLKTLIEQLIVTQPSGRNTNALVSGSATNQEWFSQPRPGSDDTTEVITAQFKLPLSISEIGFEILRVPCKAEAWYLDRQNNWRQILDRQRSPVTVAVQASSAASWYTFSVGTYPIVAQAVQIRITRTFDSQFGASPYVVGLKNTLIKRNVYDRSQGKLPFEEEQDALGNVINKYIEDWDAAQAIDNKPFTFWKSAPMPDPQAVCSVYLDTRDHRGLGQYMDGLFLDPVYSNQSLNIYYSNDDEPGQARLSPVTLKPEDGGDLNTDWRSGKGRWDSSTYPAGDSYYRFPAQWGPMVNQDIWIGLEWTPDFDAGSPPPTNPVLFEVTPTTRITGQFAPTIYYDSGAGTIVLELDDGTTAQTYPVALSPLLEKGKALRIVVAWSYGPDTIHISVRDRLGTQLGLFNEEVPRTSPTYSALPAYITLDGLVGFSKFRGLLTSHVIKRENHSGNAENYLANPLVYVDPDPVLVNPDGSIPSTTLDNALYAVDWTLQPHGTGGAHESFYTSKTWQPVFADYVTRRGKMFFPSAITAKYLKLELTNLTEESYPVYDAGISVTYQVFPVSVQQTQTVNHPGLLGTISGLLTVGAQTIFGGLGTVNWLNPQTVASALNSVFGPVSNPVTVQSSPGYVTGSIPGTAQAPISDSTRTEVSSPYVYRRGLLDSSAMAASHIYSSGFTTWSQTLSNANELVGNAISDSFTPLRSYVTNPSAGPVLGNDWWIFPGGTLKMPAVVMNGLTALTETVVGRAPTTENRLRFNTNSIHRYDTRTVKRDAAIAYFAGIREIQPLLGTHLNAADPPVFRFDSYTESQNWVLTNTRLSSNQLSTTETGEVVGPLTTQGRIYEVVDSDFDLGMDNWTPKSGTWTWDNTNFSGRWYPGAASTIAAGATSELLSMPVTSFPNEDISEGQEITITAHARWTDLAVTNNQPGVQLGLITYLDGEVVDDAIVLDQIVYSDWSTHADSDSSANNYVPLTSTWTVPPEVDAVRIRLIVTEHASTGSVWFDSINLTAGNNLTASVYQSFNTVSDFAKLRCDFSDSGIVRSNSMWARQDPLAVNIDATALAYYTGFISLNNVQGGTWADTFAQWADDGVEWGAPGSLVNITIDSQRSYDGQRVLHFSREAGAGEVGVKVRQWTNFVPNTVFRICARWYKPYRNNNTITVRLRRVSDGVTIYQEEIKTPAVGYWYEFNTDFKSVPNTTDQTYTVELVTTGDSEDELYLSDLWVEISHIRYLVGLGGALYDVTDLRYADTAIVSCPVPVTSFSVEARIYSPRAYVYGCRVQPIYLK